MKTKTFFLLFFFNSLLIVYPQQKANIPLGTWRTHASLRNASCIATTPTKIYVGTKGGLFYLDKSTNEVKNITITDGLSDLNITDIAYNDALKTLVIVYESGAVDLLKNDKDIISILDIKKSNRSGSKKINKISLIKNFAVLGCDFGGVLIDLIKNEIKESYLNIGDKGSLINVNDVFCHSDSVFLATSQGLLKSKFTNRNLLDFNTWTNVKIDANSQIITTGIAKKDNFFWIATKNKIYSNENGNWKIITTTTSDFKIINSQNQLFIISNNLIIKYTNNKLDTLRGNFTSEPTDLEFDNNILYHSDKKNTLVRFNNQQSERYFANTPHSDLSFKTLNFDNAMLLFGSGYNLNMDGLDKYEGFSIFKDGSWNNYIPGYNSDNINNMHDYADASYDKDRKLMYYASVDNGIYTQELDFEKPNEGSRKLTLVSSNRTEKCRMPEQYEYDGSGTRTVAVHYSKDEDATWICAPVQNDCVFKLKQDRSCQFIRFCDFVKDMDGTILKNEDINCRYPVKIIVDEYQNKWVQLATLNNSGIIVFNEDGGINDKNFPFKSIYLTSGIGRGNLPTPRVNCMVKDTKGNIWVGTGKGVTVFSNDGNFLSNYDTKNKIITKITDAKVPRFEGFPLLFDVYIRCIEVDGANRKWIGTDNGLYLMSEDGSRQILFFNVENSPLISNVIEDIKVNKKSGEVFINTDQGLFSYRGDATEGLETAPEEIHIFPNPMKTSYEGTVAISELGTNAKVKIIDMAGQLVYETTANGGMATWNGRGTKGEKITPGVYVVLTSKEDGEVAVSGKLFVTE